MRNYSALLISTVLLLTGCNSAPPSKPDAIQRGDYSYLKTYLSWLIDTQMRKQDIEGLSIAIVDDQHVIWAKGFGFADTANKVAATPETVYRVGSISKLFTDTLTMQLAEQGKLDIDKPLQSYLPEFAIKTRFPDAGAITPRNIMTHHSGLPSDVNNGMWTKQPLPFNQLANQLKDDYVAYAPNTIWSYSNLGLTLLGTALEKQTGMPFNLYAEQKLLKPLGMKDAKFAIGLEGVRASKSYKHHEEKPEVPLRDMPAGGLNANVLDISRFIEMVFADGRTNGQQILKSETLQEMLRVQNKDVALDAGLPIGLGWFFRNNLNIGPIAEHGGATLYQISLLSLAPTHKIGVITLSNSPNSALQKINNAALKLAVASKTGQQYVEPVEPKFETRPLTEQEQETLKGQYSTSMGYANLIKQDSGITSEIAGNKLDLVARDDGKFSIRYRLLDLFPIQPEELAEVGLSLRKLNGHEALLAETQGQTFVVGEKIRPVEISPAWRARLGDYQIINLRDGEAIIPKNCAIHERDGFLVLEYSVPDFDLSNQVLAIKPLSDTEAVLYGLGRGMRETVRVINVDGKELLAYSGYLLQKK